MKKYILMIIAAIMTVCCLAACGSDNSTKTGNTENADDSAMDSDGSKLQIVTTIFPEYDWVMNILGNNASNADVTMLLDNGVDLHSYQPTAEDIMKISTCDMFIYVGGESDEWVEDALKEAVNKDMKIINLLDVLGDTIKEEEVVEGMQAEEEHDHDHSDEDAEEHGDHEDEDSEEHEGHEHEEGEVEYDEHVWLSLNNAVKLVERISTDLQQIDPANAGIYKSNSESYIDSLNKLDSEYKKAVSDSSVKTLLFGDRFPFRYLVDDYGLSYYAAFVGCSAETEASFETVTFLSEKVDELSLHSVMTIEGSDQRIAETIVQNTKTKDQKILTLDSLQSVTADDVENGKDYIGIMESNLAVLKEALK